MATVVCERHGLRFDPERASGCVLCRRERADEPSGGPAPAARTVDAIGPAVALTLAIWVLGGALLFGAHRQAAASLRAWGFGAPAADVYGGPDGFDSADPGAWAEDEELDAGDAEADGEVE